MQDGEPGEAALTGWRFLSEDANLVVFVIDRDGMVRYTNHYAKKITGYDMKGRHMSDILLLGTWTAPDGETLLERWLNHPPPHLMNIRTSGELPQTLYVRWYPFEEGFLIFGQKDDTELDRLNRDMLKLNHELTSLSRELNQKNAELSQLNALKNQFLGMAAHDLRNPVGIVMNYAEFLMEDLSDQLDPQQKKFLETILSNAERMKQVINDFLDVSIIESGHLSLSLQEINPREVIEKVKNNLILVTKKRQVRIETSFDPDLMKLYVDGPKMEQVFTNIMGNAVEHSPDGGCVTVSGTRVDDGVMFMVKDQGMGIPRDQQKRLFESFAGTGGKKKSGERSIGLGLVISRKVVEAHGGRMFVESEPGKGSAFGFVLPHSCLARSTGQVSTGLSEDRG